jgi:hypothetical protein
MFSEKIKIGRKVRWLVFAFPILFFFVSFASAAPTITVTSPNGGESWQQFTAAPTGVALAGVHWYSGDSGMLDTSAPLGKRGWNIEAIYDANSGGGSVRANAQRASDHGMVNIIRIDYRNYQAVPKNPSEYDNWVSGFNSCIQALRDIATLFIVGNEPNIEGEISPEQYAAAFNYLYARKPAGIDLLVAGPSGFSDPSWFGGVNSRINNTDGFAIHTYGDPTICNDPRQSCSRGGWPFDGGFLYFKDLINQIPSGFWSKPVYITEFNTDVNGPEQQPNPRQNYQNLWVNKAFQAVRDYNATRGTKPEVKALAWFVDRDDGGWGDFALRNITEARNNMGCEFKNPVNRGGSTNNCPVDGTPCIATDIGDWKGDYFNNISLSGNPSMIRDDRTLDFDWGSGSPGSSCGIGAENFSVRWTRSVNFGGGNYYFTVTADDGVRLWIDDILRIDQWRDQAASTYTTGPIYLSGNHTIRMEYYEHGGNAVAKLSWEAVESSTFQTGWENGQVQGFADWVFYSKDVAGFYNSSLPPPECSRRYHETVRSGDYSLMIAGYSRASYAYCYYRVFDLNLPVVKGMKISYWIFHSQGTPKISVDGHFTDGTNGWTIRDFNNTGYLTDQFGVRIHPAHRNDPMNGWHYVEVDLSKAAGKTLAFIMFAFDNGSDGFTGQYRAYVDDFKIFSAQGGPNPSNPYPDCPCSGDINNYCLHAPSTPGCPMTFRGGYCDPNGDGSFTDADWDRGYNEFQQYCR